MRSVGARGVGDPLLRDSPGVAANTTSWPGSMHSRLDRFVGALLELAGKTSVFLKGGGAGGDGTEGE